MLGIVALVAGVALGTYDRADYDSIYEPRTTGVPPFYALRRLTACEDGEIRHYGHAFVGGAVRNVYVASHDRGLTWKTFFTEPGDPEAMVKSPISGDWNEGANAQCGLVSMADVPYAEMVRAMRDIAAEMYTRR